MSLDFESIVKVKPESAKENLKSMRVSNFISDNDATCSDETSNVKIAYKQSISYDEQGNIVSDTIRKNRRQNGSGFVLMYSEKCNDFIKKVSSGSIVRLFFFIAGNQQYGEKGIFGFRCSKKHLCEVLNLDPKTAYNALKFLQEEFIIHVGRFNGQLEFMVNPVYVTIGTDKKKRMAEWSRRWEETWKKRNSENLKI